MDTRKTTLSLITALVLTISIVIPSLAAKQGAGLAGDDASYFVSIRGDDANPGTFALPWRHIQYAWISVGAGSTVYVLKWCVQ